MTSAEDRFSDVAKIVSYRCDDAPSPVVERALLETIIRIARDTKMLETTLTLTELQSGVDTYDFSYLLPDGYEVCQINWVMLCGCKLRPVDKCDPCPHGFEVITPKCIKLHPCPTHIDPGDVEICVALVPDYSVCELPEMLMLHEDTLVDGTMANLTAQFKKAWGDRAANQLYGRRFQAALTRLTSVAQDEYTTNKRCRLDHGFI